jgi:hypothetical protein
MGYLFLGISFLVAFFFFLALKGFDLHPGARLAFTALPIVVAYFLGLIGLLGSAIRVLRLWARMFPKRNKSGYEYAG